MRSRTHTPLLSKTENIICCSRRLGLENDLVHSEQLNGLYPIERSCAVLERLMSWGTCSILNSWVVLLLCELFYVCLGYIVVEMAWYIWNNWVAFLLYEPSYGVLDSLRSRMTWGILNNCRVSLQCAFLHASANRLLVQMILVHNTGNIN